MALRLQQLIINDIVSNVPVPCDEYLEVILVSSPAEPNVQHAVGEYRPVYVEPHPGQRLPLTLRKTNIKIKFS